MLHYAKHYVEHFARHHIRCVIAVHLFFAVKLTAGNYVPPSPKSVRERLRKEYISARERTIAHMSVSGSKICLTIDYWTSPNQIPFLVVTARWVSPDHSKFINCVLDFRCVDASHTAEETAAEILKILEEYNLCDKVNFLVLYI